MSCFPSPSEYAALLAAGQHQVLSQLMRSQAAGSAEDAAMRGGGGGVCTGGSNKTCNPTTTQTSSTSTATPLPPPQDLVPLQPLLAEYLANAFRIPPLPNLPGPPPRQPPAHSPPHPPFFCTLPAMPPGLQEVYPRPGVMPVRPFPAPGLYFPGAGPRPVVPPVSLMVPGVQLGGVGPCTNAPFPHPYVSFPGLPPPHDTQPQPQAGFYKGQPGCHSHGGAPPRHHHHHHHRSGSRRKRRAERKAGHLEEFGSGGEHSYPMKRSRLVWTPELHQRFLEAVNRLGNDAVPKNIMQVMNVEGLTRSNVASHLQKYRLQMKRCEEHCTDVNDGVDADIQDWSAGNRTAGKLVGEDNQNVEFQSDRAGRERSKEFKSKKACMGSDRVAGDANVSVDRSYLPKTSSCSLYSRSEGSTQPSAGNSNALPISKDKGNGQCSITENSPVINYGYTMGIDMQAALLEWSAQMGLKVNDRDWERGIVSRLMNSHIGSETQDVPWGRVSRSNSHPPAGPGVHDEQGTAFRQSLDQNRIPGLPGSQPADCLADKESRTLPVVENEC